MQNSLRVHALTVFEYLWPSIRAKRVDSYYRVFTVNDPS